MRPSDATRRELFLGLGAGLGGIALSSLLADEARKPHVAAKARACIFLTMEGGPSHLDTFDPKPALTGQHLKRFVRQDAKESAMSSGPRYYVRSPFKFRKAGRCGADMAVNWEHLAGVADELCFYRGCQVDSVNHPTALYQMNTGNRSAGDPAVGAWVTYGLGTVNRDLPGFVVLPEVSHPQGGAANWGSGFLPADHQGTPLRAAGSPILDLAPGRGVSRGHQRANLDLLAELNRRHAEARPGRDDLAARADSYELAFRMQAEVPGLLDLSREPRRVQARYGIGEEPTDAFGRKCLLARRLVQRGVRFVQMYAGSWDSHDDIERGHGSLIRRVDRPIAGLIADLKQTGLLDSTLVVWCGEFGRTPDNGVRMGTAYGRDHNPKAMTVWFAGGGVRAGHTVGATDELGAEAVECVHPIRDVHVTILRLLGLEDAKLTYFHGGRFKQLSQFGGQVINELIG
ncbi:MAG: DUF1501 domain-containing protein [Gemmataceae bacterium]